METAAIILCAIFAAIAAYFYLRLRSETRLHKALLSTQQESARREVESLRQGAREQKELYEQALKSQKDNYDKTLQQLRDSQQKALEDQARTLKAELAGQTDKMLRQREDALSRKAEETFKTITGSLGKDFLEMKAAFENNSKAHTESSAALGEKFDNAVRNLEKESRSIGDKADRLAEAMSGQKKLQGCWGETILLNLLTAEGMAEGRDFDREQTLRDADGKVLHNEDSDKKMRPDFILHYPGGQDVVVDAKVSLSAFSAYLSASDDASREAAAKDNLNDIKAQVKRLSAKDYSSYLLPGHKMLDYVIMFIPTYPALQLAQQADPGLWRNAYRQKVLITTEETIMPFLRMISIAWCNVEQLKNQQKIVEAAGKMVERVAEFAESYAKMGEKLQDAVKAYDKGKAKISEGGQSILTSAKQVLSLGVRTKKALPSWEEPSESA